MKVPGGSRESLESSWGAQVAPGSAPWSTRGTPGVLEETCELQKEPKMDA